MANLALISYIACKNMQPVVGTHVRSFPSLQNTCSGAPLRCLDSMMVPA